MELQQFISDFGFLNVLRISNVKFHAFSADNIFRSTELTLGSIIECMKAGCVADANILLRKYRDDLFFFLYIDKNREIRFEEEQDTEADKYIKQWLKNGMNRLNAAKIIDDILESEEIKESNDQFHIHENLKRIAKNFNNYTHGNGYTFYNSFLGAEEKKNVLEKYRQLADHAQYITSAFLFIVFLNNPFRTMAEDYIDDLDIGQKPDEEKLHWIAPFIESYCRKNMPILGKDCMDYLKDRTDMIFTDEV